MLILSINLNILIKIKYNFNVINPIEYNYLGILYLISYQYIVEIEFKLETYCLIVHHYFVVH